MNAAKVQLSKEELTLVSDPQWILTKNSIMGRGVELLAGLSEKISPELGELRWRLLGELQQRGEPGELQQRMPGELQQRGELGDSQQAEPGSAEYTLPPNWDTPKISRGENYMGLPYVILDQPRLFSREHILAIRTMFWWGNYFSVTLHVKGYMLDMFQVVISRHVKELAEAGFHIATSGDEWRHELEAENYAALTDGCIDPEGEYPFLKLSARCPLDKWNEAPEILLGLCKILIHALTAWD